MTTRIVNKTAIDNEGVEIIVKSFQLSYEGGTLTVSQIGTDEEGNETIVPTMIQPWKCNDDGTRTDFVGEADAFDWFESMKNILV